MIKWTKLLSRISLLVSLSGACVFAAAPPAPQGFISGKAFTNITGTAISALTNLARFPSGPDGLYFLPYFEWNAGGDISVAAPQFGDNYGAQMVGYFYPPATGNYVFWMASDDNGVLYLSTDSDPAHKKLIARETVYSNAREYFSSAGASALADKDSSQFAASEWPDKDPNTGLAVITLQANQPYYIEAISKEGAGGDHLSVAVQDPNFTIDSSAPIPGQFLSSDRTNGPVQISRQPQSITVPERGSGSFSVMADGTPPYTFQWRKEGADILDATSLTYTVSNVTMADNGAKFSVVVTGGEGTATSQDAVLTVEPDVELPKIVSVKGSPNLTEVTVTFSEPVDATTGAAAANYQISSSAGPLNITGVTVSANGTQATLTTATQTLGTKYTLLVNNVKDTAATPNTIAANSKVVFFPTGRVVETNGFIVFEAENFDRNLDDLWVKDTARGTPSGGVSMVNPNGAGGSESATQLEYDVEFKQTATYKVWYLASGDNGNDDSIWFHIDGDRPVERATGNQASMTGFSGALNFVWRSDAQDAPDPFTVDIATPGVHVVGIARREDGAYIDKMILTTDMAYTPTGFGPPETREGAPGIPTVTLSAPTAGQTFAAGNSATLSAQAAGSSGLDIVKVQFTTNDVVVGEGTRTNATDSFTFTWTNLVQGVYGIRAIAYDELGQSTISDSVAIEVTGASQKPKVAWVSFHPADNQPSNNAKTAGFTNAPDAAYTALLRTNGYDVTRFLTSGTPDTNVLNTFDLVIISRSVPSGDYQDPAETLAWNTRLTAPTIVMSGYIIRLTRLGLATADTPIPDTIAPITLTVTDTNHPIFKGVQFDANNTMVNNFAELQTFNGTTERGISVVTAPLAGAPTILATVGTASDPAFGGPIIAEWKAGDTTGNARGDVLGGDRLLFLSGSREHNGLTSDGAGIFDLTPDGAKLFINAVNYMAGVTGQPPAPAIAVSGNASGLSITFTGTLEAADSIDGPWTTLTGVTSPYPVSATGPVKFFRSQQ
jgi:hypothetical protein